MLSKATDNICIGIGTGSTEKLDLALYHYQGFKFFMMALLKDIFIDKGLPLIFCLQQRKKTFL